MAAIEVFEAVLTAKTQEIKKGYEGKANLFSREVFSIIEVLLGRPEGEAYFLGDTLYI